MKNQATEVKGRERARAYYEKTDENHNKFYEVIITQSGNTYQVTAFWGRIDTLPAVSNAQQKYEGPDKDQAKEAFHKVCDTRTAHGYNQISYDYR